jgi:hypothetical protein
MACPADTVTGVLWWTLSGDSLDGAVTASTQVHEWEQQS